MTGRHLILGAVLAMSALPAAPALALTKAPKTVASLGVQFQNDNEGLEPTTGAERARMQLVDGLFKSELEKSGQYKFTPTSGAIKERIALGQPLGHCGGCEFTYAKDLSADTVAWIEVQKVSNLILNMNLYVGDVASQKITFVHSVDIRGNTDESWSRSLTYLLKNYFLKPAAQTQVGG